MTSRRIFTVVMLAVAVGLAVFSATFGLTNVALWMMTPG